MVSSMGRTWMRLPYLTSVHCDPNEGGEGGRGREKGRRGSGVRGLGKEGTEAPDGIAGGQGWRLWMRCHLVDGDDVAELDPQVLTDDLVDADLWLLACVVGENNAHGILPLLSLSASNEEATRDAQSQESQGKGLSFVG